MPAGGTMRAAARPAEIGRAAETAGILRNSAALGAARGATLLLDAAAYVLVARYLGPADYGIYISILAFVLLLDFSADLMLLDITVREIARKPDQAAQWVTASAALRLALALPGLAAFAGYLGISRPPVGPSISTGLILAALILPAGALRAPLSAFRAGLVMQYELVCMVAARAINLIAVLAVLRFNGGLNLLFLAALLSRVVLGGLSCLFAWKSLGLRPSFSLAAVRRLFWEALPMGLSGAAVAIQLKADILLLSWIGGAAAAGTYAVVAQLPEYFLYLPVILTTPMLSLLSRYYAGGDRSAFQQLYQRMFDALTMLIIPAATMLAILRREMVLSLFGPAYSDAARVVPLLMAGIIFMWISHATAIGTVAAGLQRSFVWIQGICVAVFLVLCAALIPAVSAAGAAAARLAGIVIAPILTAIVLRRGAGVSLRFTPLLRTLGAAAVMAAVLIALRDLSLVAAIAAGALAYGAVLWLAMPQLWTRARAEEV